MTNKEKRLNKKAKHAAKRLKQREAGVTSSFHILVTPALKQDFKAYCAKQGLDMSSVLLGLVQGYMERSQVE